LRGRAATPPHPYVINPSTLAKSFFLPRSTSLTYLLTVAPQRHTTSSIHGCLLHLAHDWPEPRRPAILLMGNTGCEFASVLPPVPFLHVAPPAPVFCSPPSSLVPAVSSSPVTGYSTHHSCIHMAQHSTHHSCILFLNIINLIYRTLKMKQKGHKIKN